MNEDTTGSVTHWLGKLQGGAEGRAQRELWNHYFTRLAALARKRLISTPRMVADEEDVVLSVFASFFERARKGQFPDLHDRSGLWRLLATITARKAMNQAHRQTAQKRMPSGDIIANIEQIVGREPTPDFAYHLSEELHTLLAILQDDNLQTIAIRKLEGYTNQEIAAQLGMSLSTIARKLVRIRSEWQEGNELEHQ